MKMMWCISCEKIVPVEEPISGHSIVQFVPDEGVDEVCFCEGPFVEFEADIDPDWDLNLEEPSGDELFIMNKNAEYLLLDLGIE